MFILYIKHTTYIYLYTMENPTKELIKFLIKRNKKDVERLNLKHFKNIKCKELNISYYT